MREEVKKQIVQLWEEYVDYMQCDERWTPRNELNFNGFIEWLSNSKN